MLNGQVKALAEGAALTRHQNGQAAQYVVGHVHSIEQDDGQWYARCAGSRIASEGKNKGKPEPVDVFFVHSDGLVAKRDPTHDADGFRVTGWAVDGEPDDGGEGRKAGAIEPEAEPQAADVAEPEAPPDEPAEPTDEQDDDAGATDNDAAPTAKA